MSLLVGFFLGTYLITNSDQDVLKSIKNVLCKGSPQLHIRSVATDLMGNAPRKLHVHDGVLYIGVMSTKNNFNTRIAAMLDTWAKHPNVKVEIFANDNASAPIGTGSVKNLRNGANMVSLPGVADISYPPQKKSFSMLKFMYDNYLDKFHWFLRADDDAYVKVEELIQYLSKIDSSRSRFIGHAGYGKHADDYLFGENYCMGGTGVLMSRETLRRVGPKLSECIRNMYTEHEDIELGRCVRNVTGISCTTAWETSSLFYQNFGGKGSYDDNIEDIAETKRVAGLIFHANKDPKYQYKLHRSILSDKISKLLLRITRMETESKKMLAQLAMRKFDVKAWNAHGGYVWDAMSRRSLYSAGSQLVRHIPAAVKDAAVQNVYYTLPKLRKRHHILKSHVDEIVIASTRYYVNPFTSADMIAKLKLRLRSKKSKQYVYLNNVYFRRAFPDSLVYLNEPHTISRQLLKQRVDLAKLNGIKRPIEIGNFERINFVMALSGRPENLKRFLKNFDEQFLKSQQNVTLTVVFYPEKTNPSYSKTEPIIDVDGKETEFKNVSRVSDVDFVQSLLDAVSEKYPESSPLKLIPVQNGLSFSRGPGLQIGAKSIARDEILFFCDVDLIFTPAILFHIRRSTIKGRQVYYPTFFSQYDPEIVYSYQDAPDTQFYFEEIAGFWRTFSYGMVSMYKSDFLNTGGFDLSIHGWGLEDLRLCDAILRKANLQVFKANEPSIVHIYHDKDCPSDLADVQRNSCQKSRAQHFGPQTLMYYLWQRAKDGDEDIEENEPNVEVDNLSRDSARNQAV